ncbi:rRNA-processing protein [Perilla frutescens var. hirtella]|nr:rRNA-processing protein [Perilla frutescens var. hirtella]KAH6811120.1 rRNA-processing protein [Perilla frutescens var. frutescens]
MKKGGGVFDRYENKERKIDGVTKKKKMKRNMQRLGGRGGLSLETFANAKTRNDNYNPSLIKKQREFYKNAKCVRKYKKSINQQEQQSTPSTAERLLVGENETKEREVTNQKNKNKKNARNLEELYTKKHEEQERARIEREAMIQAKKEQREVAEARRRALKEKMYKKTRSGQPVMKYRIEHLLETIQGPAS